MNIPYIAVSIIAAMALSTMSAFSQKILATATINDKSGCIDIRGNEVVPIIYDDIMFWGEGMIPVNIGAKGRSLTKEGGMWGFCDTSGRLVIDIQFDKAYWFQEGRAAVMKDNRWGFIDRSGKIVVPFSFRYASLFFEGLCAVQDSGGKWGFIDTNGTWMIPPQYDEAHEFEDGRARVFIGTVPVGEYDEYSGKFGVIDRKGNYIVEPAYDYIWHFSEGYARVEVRDSGSWFSKSSGFIDRTGKLVVPAIYDRAEDFKEGRAVVCFREKMDAHPPYYRCGYIDSMGNQIVPPQYDNAHAYRHGRAVVEREEKGEGSRYALLDHAGKIILPFDYELLYPIDTTRYIASNRIYDGAGVIDYRGNVILPMKYSTLRYLGENYFSSGSTGRTVLNIDGTILFSRRDLAIPSGKFTHGIIGARTSDYTRSGFVDLRGEWVIPPRYDMIHDFEDVAGTP